MAEAIAVMLNNYFHDLAVAFLFASTLMAHVVLRHWPGRPGAEVTRLLERVAWASFAWVLVGGAVRAWFYREYEWLPSAGRGQVAALVAKHVVLVGVTVWGLVGLARLRRAARGGENRPS